MFTHPSRD